MYHDTNHFLNSKRSIQRHRVKWGLLGTRQQKQSFNAITPFVQEIKERFPNMGARQLVSTLRQDYLIKVSECVSFSLAGIRLKFSTGRQFSNI